MAINLGVAKSLYYSQVKYLFFKPFRNLGELVEIEGADRFLLGDRCRRLYKYAQIEGCLRIDTIIEREDYIAPDAYCVSTSTKLCRPPRNAELGLSFLLKYKDQDDILLDLTKGFYRVGSTYGYAVAYRWYWVQAIRAICTIKRRK